MFRVKGRVSGGKRGVAGGLVDSHTGQSFERNIESRVRRRVKVSFAKKKVHTYISNMHTKQTNNHTHLCIHFYTNTWLTHIF